MKQTHRSLPTERPDFELNSRREGTGKMKGNGWEDILSGLFFVTRTDPIQTTFLMSTLQTN